MAFQSAGQLGVINLIHGMLQIKLMQVDQQNNPEEASVCVFELQSCIVLFLKYSNSSVWCV